MHLRLSRCLVVAALLSLALCSRAGAQNRTVPDCIRREMKDAAGASVPCQIYLPLHYNKRTKYPLLLCFHGAGGGKGGPFTAKPAASTQMLLPEMREKYPAFVLVPQTTGSWTARPAAGPGVENSTANPVESLAGDSPTQRKRPGGMVVPDSAGLAPEGPALKLALQCLAEVMKEYSVDPNRIYVSGQSMGGVATWCVITTHPDLFAAAVPICGIGNPQAAAKIGCPVGVFHGTQDPTVPVHNSRNMVEALKKAGRVEVKYTEYPGGKHAVWSDAWKEPELAPWVFAKRRGQK